MVRKMEGVGAIQLSWTRVNNIIVVALICCINFDEIYTAGHLWSAKLRGTEKEFNQVFFRRNMLVLCCSREQLNICVSLKVNEIIS